jgi:hypothetical protein
MAIQYISGKICNYGHYNMFETMQTVKVSLG